MNASRAYWFGCVLLFAMLLLASAMPAGLGLLLVIPALWAGAQVVRGRWARYSFVRWATGAEEPGW